jgi:hypothetical protein
VGKDSYGEIAFTLIDPSQQSRHCGIEVTFRPATSGRGVLWLMGPAIRTLFFETMKTGRVGLRLVIIQMLPKLRGTVNDKLGRSSEAVAGPTELNRTAVVEDQCGSCSTQRDEQPRNRKDGDKRATTWHVRFRSPTYSSRSEGTLGEVAEGTKDRVDHAQTNDVSVGPSQDSSGSEGEMGKGKSGEVGKGSK